MIEQLTIFNEVQPTTQTSKQPKGGSKNPIVFYDYESFVAKFTDNPKTTDDCFTPKDVYEAVVKYVGSIYDLTDKVILRPFYPGGDYRHAEYPENGVVIDNPPFSLFVPIVEFFTNKNIPFFLFGPGLTISSCCRFCTAIIISEQIMFDNGAKIKCNFASNLFGDTIIKAVPKLDELLKSCKSQEPLQKKKHAKYEYPAELLSVGQMQTICKGGFDFEVSRKECKIVRYLDLMDSKKHKDGLYGNHFLLSHKKAKEKNDAMVSNIETEIIELSDREKNIIDNLYESE